VSVDERAPPPAPSSHDVTPAEYAASLQVVPSIVVEQIVAAVQRRQFSGAASHVDAVVEMVLSVLVFRST